MASEEWPKARKTKAVREGVFKTLCEMTGKRQRCMYCEDSRGTDIDHFWPKSSYPKRVFEWPNMVLSCSGCNRAKGDRFPLDKDGVPELIDPTAEDPWDFLYYVSEAGVVTPRYDPATGEEFCKGRRTITLLPLNDEAIADERMRVARRLRAAVKGFLQAAEHGFPTASREQAVKILEDSLRDNAQFGLVHWFFSGEGQREEPFRKLGARFPEVFQALRDALLLQEEHGMGAS
jgi:uncharacterized protein (TIGR02646 family)